jgi:cytochrome c553
MIGRARLAIVASLTLSAACQTTPSQPSGESEALGQESSARTVAAGMDAGLAADYADGDRDDGTFEKPEFCQRPDSDAVRDVFCVDAPPAVGSLRALQDLLGVNPAALADEAEYDAATPLPSVASDHIVDVAVFLSHSTALSGHLVSSINPRAIFLGQDTILTFQRGVQQIEFATQSRQHGDFNFYLLTFRQTCNERPEGCRPGDLYTPAIETGFRDVRIEDDEDLKNTTLDCRQCHQRGREMPALLMRELQAPWTHFFEPDTELPPGIELPGVRGTDLVRDYLRAKGNEPYAGMSVNTIRHTVGLFLQNVVEPEQPLLFDAPQIEEERWPFVNGGYAKEPQPSPTWERGYAAFKRGEQLALPYYEPRPSDPEKQARLTEAYARYRRGELDADALPDMADIFPADPLLRAKIGLQTEPGASAPEALVQACGTCHNDVLDQTLSRARFNVDLSRMSRAELDVAIARLQLPRDAQGAMPPPEGRQLDDVGRARVIDYLRKNARTPADDALLTGAARAGMAGGRGR